MPGPLSLRVTYLGPEGTFNEDALRIAAGEAPVDAVPAPTVYAAIIAVQNGDADRALVPFENSIEGGVRSTLDTLAFDADGVTIVGEHDYPVTHCLIAREEIPLGEVEAVLSHPQATAQCARFLREQLPQAHVRAASSTAEAVRQVSEEKKRRWAALGAAAAARLYDCAILRDGVEDEPDNVTRFVWVAPAGTAAAGDGPWRTTLIFSELGADHPGALVEALGAFSERGVNLTRIESRPRRSGLGAYMFFVDCEGAIEDAPLAEALEDLRSKAESVRVLGSYPTGAGLGVPGESA